MILIPTRLKTKRQYHQIKLELGVLSRKHTWPSPVFKLLFIKCIAYKLSNNKKGRKTRKKYQSYYKKNLALPVNGH